MMSRRRSTSSKRRRDSREFGKSCKSPREMTLCSSFSDLNQNTRDTLLSMSPSKGFDSQITGQHMTVPEQIGTLQEKLIDDSESISLEKKHSTIFNCTKNITFGLTFQNILCSMVAAWVLPGLLKSWIFGMIGFFLSCYSLFFFRQNKDKLAPMGHFSLLIAFTMGWTALLAGMSTILSQEITNSILFQFDACLVGSAIYLQISSASSWKPSEQAMFSLILLTGASLVLWQVFSASFWAVCVSELLVFSFTGWLVRNIKIGLHTKVGTTIAELWEQLLGAHSKVFFIM